MKKKEMWGGRERDERGEGRERKRRRERDEHKKTVGMSSLFFFYFSKIQMNCFGIANLLS